MFEYFSAFFVPIIIHILNNNEKLLLYFLQHYKAYMQ